MTALALVGVALASDAEAQILGTAEDFGVLAGTTVTNTGPSVISGHVGVSPGGAVVGFPPGIVLPPGTIHAADAVAGQAQVDLTAAYNTLQGLPSQVDLTGQNLGGLVLPPAVYSFATSAQLTGVLTLNGLGNTAAQWVFQIGSTLTTASNSAILLINGANGNNVYWAVGSSATLGTNSVFAGNIVALTSITLNTGASITCGRALARNGAVTLDNNVITLCAASDDGDGGDISANVLFGGGVTGAQQAAFRASSLFGATVMGEAALFGSGVAPGYVPQTLTGKRSIKDDATISNLAGIVIDQVVRTWRLWATGFGGTSWFDGSASAGSGDLHSRTVGIAAGFERLIDPTTVVGISVGYTNSGFSVDQMQTSGTVEGVHMALYGVKHLGPFYLAAAAEYAFFHNTTNRSIDWIVDERAQGNFASDEYGARIEAGMKLLYKGYKITPFVGLRVAHLSSDGFAEQSVSVLGGPGILGLTFQSHSGTSVESSVGIQVAKQIALSNGQILTPYARVAWVHEFNPDRSLDVSLTASPAASFQAVGAPAASDLAKVNAGVRLDVTDRLALFAYGEGEFSENSQSYAGTGGFKISW